MTFRLMCVATVLVVCLLPFMMGQGCQPTTGDGTSQGTANDLTDQEKQAVLAACNAPAALGEAAEVSQNATDDIGSDDSAQSVKDKGDSLEDSIVDAINNIDEDMEDLIDDISEVTDDISEDYSLGGVTFGTCPEVTQSGSLLGTGLDVTIDFGEEACTALTVQQEDGELYTYACSGSASGSLSLTGQSLSLTFSNISCNDEALDGSASLTYSLLVPGVQLSGSWDLTYTYEEDSIGTAGSGTVSYVPVVGGCCDVTSIETFTGNITENGYEWSATMTNILVSLEKYYSFIPYSGSITIDGPHIRALTITFNENSPVTGSITISIENGRTITVTLEELEELLESYPLE